MVDYLGRFTAWRPYQHRVRAAVGDVMLPIPINRTTINGLFGLDPDACSHEDRFYERCSAKVDANESRNRRIKTSGKNGVDRHRSCTYLNRRNLHARNFDIRSRKLSSQRIQDCPRDLVTIHIRCDAVNEY